MARRAIQFISADKSRQLTELAERVRANLARFSGATVDFNAVGLQVLDEWIERLLRQSSSPSGDATLIWGAFLGEAFRRRFGGEWGVDQTDLRPQLGVICPRSQEGLLFVDVMEQVQRRVKDGMRESLAFYYTVKGTEIRAH